MSTLSERMAEPPMFRKVRRGDPMRPRYSPGPRLPDPQGSKGDEMRRMMLEITLGRKPDESRLAPLDAEQRKTWDRLATQIADIHARGGTVDPVCFPE